MIFHLPLRQTEGFVGSLAHILEVDLPIPDHATLSRRLKKLSEIPFRAAVNHQSIHLLIDSTGLRIHVGPLRKPPKRRAWRKLHLAVDEETGETVASELTDDGTHDCTRIGPLSEQIDNPLAPLLADGAYDATGVDGSGTNAQATAGGAWLRMPSNGTRRSLVEVCEVEPSLGSALRCSWRSRSSIR
jgi:hypothetical protein